MKYLHEEENLDWLLIQNPNTKDESGSELTPDFFKYSKQAVSANMEVRCKCHGLSGSCELRTCWRSAPDFRRVGTELKNKFRRAIMIDQTGFGNRPFLLNRGGGNGGSNKQLTRQQRRKRRDRQSGLQKETNIDLWYYERSPTYCESNPDFDFPGTSGRRCNKTEGVRDAGSCSTLCCGRGYNTIRQVYTTRCNCLFKWCCEVICQNCTIDEWVTVCKWLHTYWCAFLTFFFAFY